MPRLWALSDLHLSHPGNRAALEDFPAHPDDWLILAGDVTHGAQRLDRCLAGLTPKFRQIVWVPGNHELWTIPDRAPGLRGVALYEHLVGIARSHRVLTPEDPWPVVEHPDGPVLIAPLLLLFDGVPFQEVSLGYPRQWNRQRGIGAYLREVTLAPRGATVR